MLSRRVNLPLSGYHNKDLRALGVCVRALACFCVMEFNRACSPDHRVFMWVCARLGPCVDVRSEEEVPVFV